MPMPMPMPMLRFVVVLVLVIVLVPAVAAAQPGPDDAGGRAPGQVAPLTIDQARRVIVPGGTRKDPTTALATSLLVTGAGYGLTLLGAEIGGNGNQNGVAQGMVIVGSAAALIGPTTGHIYAGHTWSAGLGIRLLSAGVMTVGMVELLSSICYDDCSGSGNGAAGAALLVGGALGYVGGTIYEIATAGDAAREYNHEHGLDMQLSLLPVRDARNATTPGVGLVGRF